MRFISWATKYIEMWWASKWIHFGFLLPFWLLFGTFWQSWLIFILHCGVLQIVECVTAEAFMKFFKLFYVLKICSYVFMLCNIEIPNIVVILIQQSFRHYPFISKNGNIIILKYADLNWVLAWLIKNKILLIIFWICRLFADLFFLQTCFFADLFFCRFVYLQTCCCIFWICRLFCRLAFFIFADLLF